MITKAIIKEIIDKYQVRVDIPLLNSTLDSIVCTLPKAKFYPEIGDIVFVAFEDYDLGKPVIIGSLFKESSNTSNIDINAVSLKVDGHTTLSSDTTIGNITFEQLKYLEGLQQNIQSTFELIDQRLNNLEGN